MGQRGEIVDLSPADMRRAADRKENLLSLVALCERMAARITLAENLVPLYDLAGDAGATHRLTQVVYQEFKEHLQARCVI